MPAWPLSQRIASWPHSASIRRTPLAMAVSETSMNAPMSPVRRTCVPPHSSRLTGMPASSAPATVTTRTWAPYFSPNSAIAPSCLAWSMGITSHDTSRLRSTHSMTRSSIRLSVSAGGASKWV